ncbi:MAG: ribokinase, partial [Planctomycetota bacterium]
MSCNVCVVGSANMDLVISTPRFAEVGETVFGTDFAMHPGGKGANQAVAASRLDAQVRFVGAVGDDEWGSQLRSVLTAYGVDLHFMKSVEKLSTGVGVITVLPDGDNSIVVASGANSALSAADIDAAGQAIRAADVLMLQGEVPAEANRRAIEIARDASTFVLLNAAPATGIEYDMLRDVDLLVANEGEARMLLDLGDQDVSPGGLARRLASHGPECVVLTLG